MVTLFMAVAAVAATMVVAAALMEAVAEEVVFLMQMLLQLRIHKDIWLGMVKY